MSLAFRGLCPLLQVFDTMLRVKTQPPKVAPYGMRQLCAIDPDGYGICLQWPTEADGPKDSRATIHP